MTLMGHDQSGFPGDPVVMAAVPLAMASERRSITRDQSPKGADPRQASPAASEMPKLATSA